jgi:ethanolamine utilization protein EutM
MIETKGLVACIEAADAMVKAAGVTLLQRRAIGGGYMTIMVRGDVGAVRTALEAGAKAARRIGEVVSTRILPSPHLYLEDILPAPVEE